DRPRPDVAHGLERRRDRRFLVRPHGRGRVEVSPGALHPPEGPRVRVPRADDIALLQAAPLLDRVAGRVARRHARRAEHQDGRRGEVFAMAGGLPASPSSTLTAPSGFFESRTTASLSISIARAGSGSTPRPRGRYTETPTLASGAGPGASFQVSPPASGWTDVNAAPTANHAGEL